MFLSREKWADRLYLALAGVFIASLIAGNLIFQKFFYLDLGFYRFEQSVGILPFPVTFLVTDIVSEIYGKKKADQIVIAGFISSLFIMGITMLADWLPSTSWSPVQGKTFSQVFGLFGPAVLASMTAYLTAQLIDIRIFEFWKKLTKGKHLWLRNNGSTIVSQFVDTFAVLFLLCSLGAIKWELFGTLLLNGFLFKMLIALIDTPFFYLFSWYLRKSFRLDLGETLKY